MGDAKDAGVLILLVPGVLSPLFVIFKILVFRLLGWKLNRPLLWRIFFTALAESSLPMITLLISFPILLVTRLVATDLLEQRWFRIPSLLILLLVVNCAVNHLIQTQ